MTLIFCLWHCCTRNQSLQVIGRIEREFNGSETLQVSPLKSLPSVVTSLNSEVIFNCKAVLKATLQGLEDILGELVNFHLLFSQ